MAIDPKRRLALFACCALISAGAAAATPSDAVNAFHAALHGGDKDRALALMSPAVMIYESGYVERTRDEYANHHLTADIAFAKATTRKVLRHSERVDGAVATVLDETETSGAFKGKPVHSFGVETAVLEKQGDGWVIVHVHWSSRKAK